MKEPSIRDVKQILDTKLISGYNDKRKYGRRIKLNGILGSEATKLVQTEMRRRFPKYEVRVDLFDSMCGYIGRRRKLSCIWFKNKTTKSKKK